MTLVIDLIENKFLLDLSRYLPRMLSWDAELAELKKNSNIVSEFFSGDRHLKRSFEEPTQTRSAEAPHLLQLDAIINRNSDTVLSQAKILLDEWMQEKPKVSIKDDFDYCDQWMKMGDQIDEDSLKQAQKLIENYVPRTKIKKTKVVYPRSQPSTSRLPSKHKNESKNKHEAIETSDSKKLDKINDKIVRSVIRSEVAESIDQAVQESKMATIEAVLAMKKNELYSVLT